MGRTLATIIQTLHAEEEAWKGFRRALRREDREAFDRLWRYARRPAAAASMANRPVPFEALLMGMLLELAKTAEGGNLKPQIEHDTFEV